MTFITRSLAPAKVKEVFKEGDSYFVIVPDEDFSIAIGKKGQNVWLASNIAGTRAILGANEGILIPPNDDQVLAEAINRLLGDPKLRYSLSRNAFHRIKGYSWDRITRIAAEFYETIG